jgi:predicted NAD/FAD-binding protein
VTLNPAIEPHPRTVIGEFEYSHPLLDARAVGAQDAIARRQGRHATWYAGAWLGYGFHEDGLRSAHAAAASIAEYAARRVQSVAAAA